MTAQSTTARRRLFRARTVSCPECQAAGGQPCINGKGHDMKGVHRARDRHYNAIEETERRGEDR